jgi:hypothetical protein
MKGRLKRPISLDDLTFGSWFARCLRFPAPFIVAPALKWLANRWGGGRLLSLSAAGWRLVQPASSSSTHTRTHAHNTQHT